MMLCQLRHHSPDTLQGAPSAARVVSARRGLKNDADSIGISEMRRLCLRFKAEAQTTQSIFHGFFSTGPLVFRIITSCSVKIYRT